MQSALDQLLPLLYLIGLGVLLSIVFSIVNMFSVDRVLKLVKGKKAIVFLGGEAHYGRLHVPPRGKGGFEVFYEEKAVENPLSLVAFLKENYEETGNERFLEKAELILNYLKGKGVVSEVKLKDVAVNPWAPPSLVSRKVYPDELDKLWMIASFVDFMDDEERRRRWREFTSLYSRPFLKRVKRRVYNALSYVKDKIASSLTTTVSAVTPAVPKDLKAELEKAEKQAITGFITQSYDPLLENSIGRLVTVRVDDLDGERKLYQGVLAEYSDKYLYVLDVDYRLQMRAKVSGSSVESSPTVKMFGVLRELRGHISYEPEERSIRNIWDRPIKVERITSGDKEVKVGKVLLPGEGLKVELGSNEFVVDYEISLESDVIWPKSKAVVVGLGDYPPDVLSTILGGLSLKKLKKII